ncbi:hypothetical protein [Paludibacterium denitrificans]|uniref:Uncharacterized protein n=1 Tax=Paludibacterium denitrificans TaxID=2675226 RepID=A0A844G8F7_9NEIS|nr:hypothetical protein [Paludibacterium denitrificans]MTD32603.1 hypothetical protein [Paludibacterium denitrificans]
MDKMREEFEGWWNSEGQKITTGTKGDALIAWQSSRAQPSDEQSSVVAHPADNIDTIKEDRDRNERMFLAACQTLAQISDALGLDEDDSDPESLLDAIAELKASQPASEVVSEVVRKLRYYGEVTPSCEDNPTRKLMRNAADLLAAPPAQVPDGYAIGIEAVAKMIEKRPTITPMNTATRTWAACRLVVDRMVRSSATTIPD